MNLKKPFIISMSTFFTGLFPLLFYFIAFKIIPNNNGSSFEKYFYFHNTSAIFIWGGFALSTLALISLFILLIILICKNWENETLRKIIFSIIILLIAQIIFIFNSFHEYNRLLAANIITILILIKIFYLDKYKLINFSSKDSLKLLCLEIGLITGLYFIIPIILLLITGNFYGLEFYFLYIPLIGELIFILVAILINLFIFRLIDKWSKLHAKRFVIKIYVSILIMVIFTFLKYLMMIPGT